MIVFVLTTSLSLQPPLLEEVEPDCLPEIYQTRERQYREHIPVAIKFAKSIGARVILVENNGPRQTCFDTMGCEVLYTDTINWHFVKELLNSWIFYVVSIHFTWRKMT